LTVLHLNCFICIHYHKWQCSVFFPCIYSISFPFGSSYIHYLILAKLSILFQIFDPGAMRACTPGLLTAARRSVATATRWALQQHFVNIFLYLHKQVDASQLRHEH
jgi:hypothetical protein